MAFIPFQASPPYKYHYQVEQPSTAFVVYYPLHFFSVNKYLTSQSPFGLKI